jgi:hypothetical protein
MSVNKLLRIISETRRETMKGSLKEERNTRDIEKACRNDKLSQNFSRERKRKYTF